MAVEAHLSPNLRSLREAAADVARDVLAPRAAEVDAAGVWPEDAFRALADAALMGLHLPESLGGRGEGLLALALVTEEFAAACPSSAMCFGMHCVASKVLAVRATPDQEERYLLPIAEGRHVTSLALSEPGAGAHFYIPATTFERRGDVFILNGEKSFVTSGGRADSYVVSAVAPGPEQDPGTFSCFVVDGNAPGLHWGPPWSGLGMRGNSSRRLRLDGVAVPLGNLLGREGDELWYVFDVVAPYFLVAMSGVYVGIARAAVEEVAEHLRGRTYAHQKDPLATVTALSDEVAELWIAVQRARQLLHHAAFCGDRATSEARELLFACKIEVADAVVDVTNRAMTLAGGRAYESNARLAQLLRDGRAAPVMSPTSSLLKSWLGRSLLGLPLL